MSIIKYNKDHSKEQSLVKSAVTAKIDAPDSFDALIFWTRHEKDPYEVDLTPLATGQVNKPGKRRMIPFTGRPELIHQLTPAIQEVLLWAAKATVQGYFDSLRDWWRVLDAVEVAAATAGEPMTRVLDVRLLTNVHSDFAQRNGMNRQTFGKFRSLVDITRTALGVRKTYWGSPENPDAQKHMPPEEQRRTLRFAVKRTCRSVLERWAKSDHLSQSDTEPEDPKEAELYRNVHYMRNIQKKTGKVLPSTDELCEGVDCITIGKKGVLLRSSRESVFPSHWDADAVWHQCLLNTGWNPSTITTLDVTKKFLFDHFKDDQNDSHRRFVLIPQTYELVGEKERAGGKEQVVTGQWKTQDGPGHLIRTYMERVAPLRELLKEQLAQEKLKYEEMGRKDASYAVRAAQFKKVKALEQGIRSVWLYVTRKGSINWISIPFTQSCTSNGRGAFFLTEVVHILNIQRASSNTKRSQNSGTVFAPLAPIPHVAAKDFRTWFADYVYRASNGSILHVKRALNHSLLRTTSGYIDNNLRNQEASNAARRFLNILVDELGAGRVDLTILSHLYRHNELTPEQEELLAQARALPKSRMTIACKDARHPPVHIKATPDEACDVQRCLLCLENAVLLPESLDGIAMRVEELRALQGFLPIDTWIEERYDIELKNNLMALRKFDLNQGLAARKKWAQMLACGEHYVPGLPFASHSDKMELV